MIAPGRPKREALRVEVLEGVYDPEGPQRALEMLCHAAADLFNAPIAAVNIVGPTHQMSSACFGIDIIHTERSISFCGHAILEEDDVLIVKDATRDARFSDNPLVVGDPYIVGYIGARLVTIDGLPLGTLCVVTREPLEVHQAQINALLVLRDQAMRELNLQLGLQRALDAKDDAGIRLAAVSDQLDVLAKSVGSVFGEGEPDQIRLRIQNEIKHLEEFLDAWDKPLGGGDVVA